MPYNTLAFYIVFLFCHFMCSVCVCTVIPVSANSLGISCGFTMFQIHKYWYITMTAELEPAN